MDNALIEQSIEGLNKIRLLDFQYHLVKSGKSPATLVKISSIMRRLLTDVPQITKTSVERYIFALYSEGREASYLNNIINAVRSYGIYINDPTLKEIKFFRIKEKNKATLSDEEILAFLAVPKPKQAKPDRYKMWTLFFKTMAFSGMRAGEVAALTIPQLDFGRGVFVLDHTKTTPRLVPIAPAIIPELTEHIKLLDREELFMIDGRIPDKDKWNKHFQMRIKRLGIKRIHLSTHSLRHSFITRMIPEVSLAAVQRIVGHKDIATTNHYTHLVTKDLTVALTKDPLGQGALPFDERFMQFREEIRTLLGRYTNSVDEERKMIVGLMNW